MQKTLGLLPLLHLYDVIAHSLFILSINNTAYLLISSNISEAKFQPYVIYIQEEKVKELHLTGLKENRCLDNLSAPKTLRNVRKASRCLPVCSKQKHFDVCWFHEKRYRCGARSLGQQRQTVSRSAMGKCTLSVTEFANKKDSLKTARFPWFC